MNLQQIQALSNDRKVKYSAWGKLFDHPSYKMLLEWAKQTVDEARNRELTAPTWDYVLYNRGARLAFTDLINLEDAVEAEFTGYAEEALEAAAEAEVDEHTGLDDV